MKVFFLKNINRFIDTNWIIMIEDFFMRTKMLKGSVNTLLILGFFDNYIITRYRFVFASLIYFFIYGSPGGPSKKETHIQKLFIIINVP